MSDDERLRLLHGQLEDDYRFIQECAMRHADMRSRAEQASDSDMAASISEDFGEFHRRFIEWIKELQAAED